MFKKQEVPKHAEKYVHWRNDGEGGWAFIVVGYCPDNISFFLALCEELKKDIPLIDENDITCSQITNSDSLKGHTIVICNLNFKKQKIPMYSERAMDFNF